MTKFQGKSTQRPVLKAVGTSPQDEAASLPEAPDPGEAPPAPASGTMIPTAAPPGGPPAATGAATGPDPDAPAAEPAGEMRRAGTLSPSAALRPGTAAALAGFPRAPARPGSGTAPRTMAANKPAAGPEQTQKTGQPMGQPQPAAQPHPFPVPGVPPSPTPPAAAKGPPLATAATVRPRHRGIMISFIALVLVPVLASAIYLWVIAQDEYASTVGFSVRTQEVSSSLDLLGGITRLSGGGSSDSDILYDYIHSQELVEALDAEIDLRAIYAKAWPADPVFAFDPSGSVEDLVDHWKSKVKITYDSSSRLMTLRVLAFSREEATVVAEKILEHSTDKINALSAEAREDATRYARIEMERALDRLKDAREAMTSFRMRTRVVDPVADLQGQMGIINSLQAQLAESYVELDLLRSSGNAGDPRITQIEQRIEVIKNRMEEERRKFNEGDQAPGGEDYATMVAEFERLSVDREFAEQAYRVALAAFDAAQAEAQRKSRYLAAHIRPTLAEESEYPQRGTLIGLTGFFLLMAWAIGVLIFYSIRDRR